MRSLDATWKAPSNNGCDPVTGYVVVAVSKGHKSVVVHVGASTHDAGVPRDSGEPGRRAGIPLALDDRKE